MKQIKLKVLGKEGDKDFLDYKVLIKSIAETPGFDSNGRNQGLTIDQVRKALRITKAIKSSKDTLTLEDADYNNLKKKSESFKWAIASENVALFMDDLEAAEDKKEV